VLAALFAVLLLSVPVPARGAPMPGPRPAQFATLQVKLETAPDRFVVLRKQQLPAEGEPAVAARPGPFFDRVFDEAGCRSPRLAAGAEVAAAICGGKGGRGPRSEYVVVRAGVGIRLYRAPVAENEGGLALSEDGRRLAVVISEDQVKVLHVIDLVSNEVRRIRGSWSEPRRPFLAHSKPFVAFEAKVGGRHTVVQVDLEAGAAAQAWPEGGDARLHGLSDDGQRLLVSNKRIDFNEIFLVDPARGVIFDISQRSGDVSSASLHGGAAQMVFTARVGGACGIYWADQVIRRRTDMRGSAEHCFESVQMDRERRFLVYQQRRGRHQPTLRLLDRKSRRDQPHMELPGGCDDAHLEPTGQYLAAYCAQDERGAGLYLFAVPQERRK